MKRLVINGGRAIKGTINMYGAKNSILPILAASVINGSKDEIILRNIPSFTDIDTMLDILQSLGVSITRHKQTVVLKTAGVNNYIVPHHLMIRMRAGIFLMGPLLARLGKVRITAPGGCNIGDRPFDLHLKGLQAMGAKIEEKHGYIEATGSPKGANIRLDSPSVGATENLMMAAVAAKGETVISNSAREPEIVDLQGFLNLLGANVKGAGTETIRVKGTDCFWGGEYRVIPDRIITGTYMIAAAITRGDLLLKNVIPEHLDAVSAKLREAGVEVIPGDGSIRVKGPEELISPGRLQTQFYPGFPTDLQPPMMTLLTLSKGESNVVEKVYNKRFRHVPELVKMGADITLDRQLALVKGVKKLTGAEVEATDLRAGAALVLAGLAAKGTTIVSGVGFIDRGYQDIHKDLSLLNGDVKLEIDEKDDYHKEGKI